MLTDNGTTAILFVCTNSTLIWFQFVNTLNILHRQFRMSLDRRFDLHLLWGAAYAFDKLIGFELAGANAVDGGEERESAMEGI